MVSCPIKGKGSLNEMKAIQVVSKEAKEKSLAPLSVAGERDIIPGSISPDNPYGEHISLMSDPLFEDVLLVARGIAAITGERPIVHITSAKTYLNRILKECEVMNTSRGQQWYVNLAVMAWKKDNWA